VGGDGGGGEEDEAAKRPESGCSSAMASSVRGWQRPWSLTVSTVLHCFIKEFWFLGGAFVPPTLNVASPLGLGGGQPRAELGGGLQDALMKCNERGSAFLHILSPQRQNASPVCLICWMEISSRIVTFRRQIWFCMLLLELV
jgi:hypothetical protein